MRVALVGSVSSSWYALDALIRGGAEVCCVLGVDESRASGISDYRSLRELADRAGVPFRAFVKIDEPGVKLFLDTHRPDQFWVIGLSQLVPQSLIDRAPAGAVGFHPTMLPEGRGRAPVAWTILLGGRAAVSLFHLTSRPDAGDIIAQREVPVLPDDYSEELILRTNVALAEVVADLVPAICSGELPRWPQDDDKATFFAKRTPADGLIDWSAGTDQVYRLIRAAGRPYPGAFTRLAERKLTVWRGRPAYAGEMGGHTTPGQVLRMDSDGCVLVYASDGGLWLTEVEVDGDGLASDSLKIGDQLT